MANKPKCSCSHKKTEHPSRGCCKKCGCTWYHPNNTYIKKKLKQNKNGN